MFFWVFILIFNSLFRITLLPSKKISALNRSTPTFRWFLFLPGVLLISFSTVDWVRRSSQTKHSNKSNCMVYFADPRLSSKIYAFWFHDGNKIQSNRSLTHGIVKWFTCFFIPHKSCLSLIGHTNGYKDFTISNGNKMSMYNMVDVWEAFYLLCWQCQCWAELVSHKSYPCTHTQSEESLLDPVQPNWEQTINPFMFSFWLAMFCDYDVTFFCSVWLDILLITVILHMVRTWCNQKTLNNAQASVGYNPAQ